jgi:hypothetical protein
MRLSVLPAALVAACALAASDAHAQRGAKLPVELGIDGGVTFGLDDPKVTQITIPGQRFRIGFFMSDAVSLEPAVALNYLSADDVSSTDFAGELGVLLHAAPGASGSRFYVRPFAGFDYVRFHDDRATNGGSSSATRTDIGAGVGIKTPIASRLHARFEANFAHRFDDSDVGDNSGNQLGLRAGLSFYTR